MDRMACRKLKDSRIESQWLSLSESQSILFHQRSVGPLFCQTTVENTVLLRMSENQGEVWSSDVSVKPDGWSVYSDWHEEEKELVCCRMLVRLVNNNNQSFNAGLLSLPMCHLSVASELDGLKVCLVSDGQLFFCVGCRVKCCLCNGDLSHPKNYIWLNLICLIGEWNVTEGHCGVFFKLLSAVKFWIPSHYICVPSDSVWSL